MNTHLEKWVQRTHSRLFIYQEWRPLFSSLLIIRLSWNYWIPSEEQVITICSFNKRWWYPRRLMLLHPYPRCLPCLPSVPTLTLVSSWKRSLPFLTAGRRVQEDRLRRTPLFLWQHHPQEWLSNTILTSVTPTTVIIIPMPIIERAYHPPQILHLPLRLRVFLPLLFQVAVPLLICSNCNIIWTPVITTVIISQRQEVTHLRSVIYCYQRRNLHFIHRSLFRRQTQLFLLRTTSTVDSPLLVRVLTVGTTTIIICHSLSLEMEALEDLLRKQSPSLEMKIISALKACQIRLRDPMSLPSFRTLSPANNKIWGKNKCIPTCSVRGVFVSVESSWSCWDISRDTKFETSTSKYLGDKNFSFTRISAKTVCKTMSYLSM